MKLQKILVYLGATMPADESYTRAVEELGQGLAKQGRTLVYGGSQEGTMMVLADAVLHNGGQVIGVFTKELPMKYLYHGLTQTIITDTLAERKTEMYRLADAIIALPGSFGTWGELFDALDCSKIAMMHTMSVLPATAGSTQQHTKPVALVNLKGYYDGVIDLLQRSIQEGFTSPKYANLLHTADSVSGVCRWLDSLEAEEKPAESGQ